MDPIDYISDWAARIRSRLYTQFRSKISWLAWADLIARQAQDLEDALQTLLSLPSIDDSEGVNLDVIGRIVGQQRVGTDDETYRSYLRARILTNRSDGDTEALYLVFRALYGETIGLVVLGSNFGQAVFALRVKGVITRAQAVIGASFLRDAKSVGVRSVLEFQETESASLFTYDGTAAQGYDAGAYAGAISV